MPDALDRIDHIVVLMLENRSFDHMLGYLRLEGGRSDIDGLMGNETNEFDGVPYGVHRLEDTTFPADPCHEATCVMRQLEGNNMGFVRDFALRWPENPGLIMGYYNAADLPVYDHLARSFCICDQWFSSVPGQTWPNRLYALSGESAGLMDNPPFSVGHVPAFEMKTVFEFLDDAHVSWRYFSHDLAMLRVFRKFRLALGPIDKVDWFFLRAANGGLPAVSWIDPNFTDIYPGVPNDDHPPSDVHGGQDLVARVYNALLHGANDLWERSLLIVTYDEHGGFFDHVHQQAADDDRPEFRRYGVRVPALLISPWIPRQSVSHVVYDHTSIIKTILRRFCRQTDGSLPNMGRRVDSAADLGPILMESVPRTDALPAPQVDLLRARLFAARRDLPMTDHQQGLEALKQECIADGVPESKL